MSVVSPFPLYNGIIFVFLQVCGGSDVMADLLRKWASGAAALDPKCFRIYRGRGLRPELLFALK
jgi:hypothetical protein